MIVTTGGRGCSVSAASTSSSVWMSTSASLTRLMLWPNSVTSNSAVSWSITSLTVTGMPILNSDLTRSAARSAMRLASSPTVIASGTTTSRTCLADGPACIWARFSFSRERACSAASERARASPSSPSARLTVSLPRSRRCSSRPRVGRAGSGRLAGAWPWRAARAGGARPRPRRPAPAAAARRGPGSAARRASSSAATAGGLGALFLGLAILLGAALLVLGRGRGLLLLAAAGFLERGQPRALGLAQQFLLQLLARRRGVGRALGRLGRGLGLGRARDRRRRRRRRARRLGRVGLAGPAAACARFLTSTTTVFDRPWLKLCFTLPVSTVRLRPSGARVPSFGLSVVSLTQNPSFKSTAEAPALRRDGALAQHHVR